MVYRGHVENGVILLDDKAELPEGTLVDISIVDKRLRPETANSRSESFYDMFKDLIDDGVDVPKDASENLDHYLYGHPKR